MTAPQDVAHGPLALQSDDGLPRRRILGYSVATLSAVALGVAVSTVHFLYEAAREKREVMLSEIVESQARLIEAVARFDEEESADFSGGSVRATLAQIADAHANDNGLGETGEFTLARLEEEEIVFLLPLRHDSAGENARIPFQGDARSEPMRRALSGERGVLTGPDYRGETVLAAYRPLGELNLGIVAKMDLDEVRAPFVRAGGVALGVGLLLILGGSFFLVRRSGPLLARIENSERQFRTLVANIPGTSYRCLLDEHWTMLFMSPAIEELTGYPPEDFLGNATRTFDSSIHPDDREYVAREVQRAVDAGRPFTLEYRIRHKGGDVVWVRERGQGVTCAATGSRWLDGAIFDITDRRRAEEALRAARQAAEEANRAKSAFLANMSHELRTPMNAILGYAEMLTEDAEEAGNKDAVADLEKIHSAGKHLLSLINDVLDLSKIEAGKMDLYLETFDIPAMIEEVVSTVDTLVTKNSNRLELELDASLGEMRADLTKVRQALLNLLSNAAKFTRDGTIRLVVQSERAGGLDWVRMSVADSGIGIPPEKIDHVFEEFSQADDSTTRDYGGTGLGLPISRRFCQMMGGDITVTSTAGEGSTFTIQLPLQVREMDDEATGATEVPALEPAPGGKRRTVLVIDDDPHARDLLRRALGGTGVRVVTSGDGAEALELARTLGPSAITLDVLMPGMDGWEVLRELKSDEATRDIPVFMVTMTDDRELGYTLGATEFLTKPVRREQLVQLLERYAQEGGEPRALVVDDLEENRKLLRSALEKEGWRVSEAENGRVALEKADELAPSLILLDLMMPVMDGIEFVMEMRKRDPLRAVPIVVVTAKDMTDAEREQLSGGVVGVIEKRGLGRDSVLEQIREQVVARGADPPHDALRSAR